MGIGAITTALLCTDIPHDLMLNLLLTTHARLHFQDFVRNKLELFKQQSIVIDCVMLREEGGCNPLKRVKTFIL